MKEKISNSVIRRLPRYYRFLDELKEQGINRISSGELSRKMGLTASQIRQDFNCFGEFGQQGYGYNVDILQKEIINILGLEKMHTAIIVGVGNIGRGVAQHINFNNFGFSITGLFDIKESLVGQMVYNMPVRNISSLDEFCKENHPEAAVICLPVDAARTITAQLINLGVKAFWNFSHYDIAVDHPGVLVENVHLNDSLMTLSYKLKNN